jgi:hypothetical protein
MTQPILSSDAEVSAAIALSAGVDRGKLKGHHRPFIAPELLATFGPDGQRGWGRDPRNDANGHSSGPDRPGRGHGSISTHRPGQRVIVTCRPTTRVAHRLAQRAFIHERPSA